MGNKPFRIALKVEKVQYESGEVLKGRVYLSVDKKAQLKGVDGIHLQLVGVEQTSIPNHHHHSSKKKHHERRVETCTNTLIRVDYSIVKAHQIKIGQYEYSFQWRLPPDLPSSMHCQKKDSSNSFAEIRYTLTAYLMSSSNSMNRREPLPRSEMTVCITAQPSPDMVRRPIASQVEEYPVSTCFFWNKGKIYLGWHADSDTACPGETVLVDVLGDNKSPNEIKELTVKWIETVKWKTESAKCKVVTRTLSERKLSVEGCGWWQPWLGPTDRTENPDLDAMNRRALCAELTIPNDARDSYTGRLVTVRHMLVVSAETRGFATTTPESAYEVKIARHSAPAPRPISLEPASLPSPTAPTTTPDIPQAQIVYAEWGPIVDDPIEVPLADAVLIDEELGTEQLRQEAIARGTVYSQPLTPSAPDESLVLEHDRASSLSSFQTASSDYPLPDLDQLLTLVRDSPASLFVLLDDASWVTLVENLSPREYCRVCQEAQAQAPSVARVLALCMSRFECRHVLALLWTLPDSQRTEILRNVSPLITDLDMNQGTIERELNPTELVVFRSALGEQ